MGPLFAGGNQLLSTITTTDPHGFTAGDIVQVSGPRVWWKRWLSFFVRAWRGPEVTEYRVGEITSTTFELEKIDN